MRTARILALTAVVALVAACSGSGASPAPASQAPATAPATQAPASQAASAPAGSAAAGTVTIQGFKFEPSAITATAGGTVTWTNKDDAPHTVTFADASVTSSGNIAKDQTFEATFATAGTFTYKCTIHPSMTGQVTVS